MGNKQQDVADFDWLTVGHFFRYVEVNARLIEYSLQHIYSFYISPERGIRGLVKQKAKTLEMLRENLTRLSRWVDGRGEELSPTEKTCCRSLYRQTRSYAHTVEAQITRAKELVKWEQTQMHFHAQGTEVDDELPF